MPCTADTNCNRPGFDPNSAGPNMLGPSPNQHFANMGWVGFARLIVPGAFNNILRVTGADINLSQEITKPSVIDGRIDPSVYQLGPKIVEGTLNMPLVADVSDPTPWANRTCPNAEDLRSGTAGSVLQSTWCWATARGPQGRLLYSDASLNIRYANHAGFLFDNCIVNTYSITIPQGDMITLDIAVIGRGRTASEVGMSGGAVYAAEPEISDFLAPARVLTWNDATVTGIGGCGRGFGANKVLFYSNQVREFSFEINNNADRFYSLNGSLFPVDINVAKREITGSLTLLGLQEELRTLAESNQTRFTEKNEIRMAYYIGEDTFSGGAFSSRDWTGANPVGSPIFDKKFVGVVFQIEEMSMTNEVFETTINWHAMANDQECYEGIYPATSSTFPVWD